MNSVFASGLLSSLIFIMAIVMFFISYKCELKPLYIFFTGLISFPVLAAPISLLFYSQTIDSFLFHHMLIPRDFYTSFGNALRTIIILLILLGLLTDSQTHKLDLFNFDTPFVFTYLTAISYIIIQNKAFIFLVVALFLFAFYMLYKDEFYDKNLFWTFNVTNNIILLFSMISIWTYPSDDYLSKSLIVIASLFQLAPMFNVPSNISNSSYVNWFSLKITIYAVNIIYGFIRLENMPYVHSMLFMLIATIMITFASKTNFKPIRLYGLILAIFSTLKLLLSDISYTNSIARVLSFMIAGILCFAIVFIYNKTSDNS